MEGPARARRRGRGGEGTGAGARGRLLELLGGVGVAARVEQGLGEVVPRHEAHRVLRAAARGLTRREMRPRGGASRSELCNAASGGARAPRGTVRSALPG